MIISGCCISRYVSALCSRPSLSRILKSPAFAYNTGRDACDLHSEQDRLWLCTSTSLFSLLPFLSLSFSFLFAPFPFFSLLSRSSSSLINFPFFLFLLPVCEKKDDRIRNEEWPICTKLQVNGIFYNKTPLARALLCLWTRFLQNL